MSKKSDNGLLGCVVFIIIAIGILIMGTISFCGGWGRNYSDGERSGVVVKLSHKGFMWKSWEGEMNIGGAGANSSGTMVPTVFTFSVSDPAVAVKVQEAARSGERVSLHYTQWMIKPISVDTPYNIVDVIPLTPANNVK